MTWPDAVQFDPVRGTASPAIEALLEGPASAGPVLLLAVGPLAQQRGWAGATAIALARALGARGERVVLADLSLRNPELHSLLGSENEEGLTDVFLFGASLQHITISVDGDSFRLIPASPFTPDAREILGHRRWSGVFEELAQSRDKLLVYLPMELPGAAELADRIGRVIVLAWPEDFALIEKALTADADVVSVIAPPAAEQVSDAATAGPPSETPAAAVADVPGMQRVEDREFEQIRIPKDNAREALIADLRARQRAALMATPEHRPVARERTGATPEPQPELLTPEPADTLSVPLFVDEHTEQRPPRRGRTWVTWLLLLLVAAAAVAASWYVWRTRFAATGEPRPGDESGAVAEPPRAPASSATATVALPFSVAIASYNELNLAQERLDQLDRQAPQLPFYIAPVEVEGAMYFHLLAGPVGDSAHASALRDTLLARRIKTISAGREIRVTPFAFLLGEYGQLDDAEEQQQQISMKGVPSYIVASTGLDGSPQYTLYAGAYTGPGDAEFMRQVLRSVGLPENLVERTGIDRS